MFIRGGGATPHGQVTSGSVRGAPIRPCGPNCHLALQIVRERRPTESVVTRMSGRERDPARRESVMTRNPGTGAPRVPSESVMTRNPGTGGPRVPSESVMTRNPGTGAGSAAGSASCWASVAGRSRPRRRPRVASPRTPRRAGRGRGKIASRRCASVPVGCAGRTAIVRDPSGTCAPCPGSQITPADRVSGLTMRFVWLCRQPRRGSIAAWAAALTVELAESCRAAAVEASATRAARPSRHDPAIRAGAPRGSGTGGRVRCSRSAFAAG